MELQLHLGEEIFTVKSSRFGENTWFFPCGSTDAQKAFIKEHINQPNFTLCYMSAKDIFLLKQCFPDKFQIRLDVDACEYIFERKGHLDLRGSWYADMRRQVRKVRKEQNLRIEPINSKNLSRCMEVLKCWRERKHKTGYYSLTDRDIPEEGLIHRKELGIQGILVYVEEEPYGVAAGYPLSEDTYDIFLEKQKDNLPGLPYYIKREFFLSLPPQYLYINGEEDMGIEGLRRMKNHLCPVDRNEIWKGVVLR